MFRVFLGVFLVFLGCSGFSWGVRVFFDCSGMFRDVPVFCVPVFLEVLHAIVTPTPKPLGNSGGIHMSSSVILKTSPRPQGQIQKEISPTSKAGK